MTGLLAVAVSVAVAALVTPLAARVARRTGVVDRPGELKVHRDAVPYLGGIGVLAGIAGPAAVARPAFLVPLGLAALLGLADDVSDLPPRLRLVVEVGIGAAVTVVVPTGLGALATVATVLGTVVLINGVNLIDGLDGLASGTAAAGAFGLAAVVHGDDRVVALAVGGAAMGFLLHNRPPARVYLGDSGSYLLGTALALLVAAAWREERPLSVGIGALAAVAVPAAELAWTVLRRARAGVPLLVGDRAHLYDRLRDRQWPVARIAVTFAAAQASLATLGWYASGRPTVVAIVVVTAAWLVPFAAYLLVAQSGASRAGESNAR